ncbi:hypothetical protein QBC36DRAFT_303547 [Triangularia setosa]|uniref:Uncharacterized protein n=1 Tax=Triangularia setosa TaxID=2587417 RepID=A0AAN6W182_9PEZI|nr:hypothetical protein QBC36DRAFT_303547 [Podospora setosa]
MQFKMGYPRAQQGAVPRGSGGPHKPPSKHVEGQVDPEELTRRLLVVLAEQEAHEKRKQWRAAEQQGRHHREHQSTRHGQSQSARTDTDPRYSDHSRRRPSQANLSTSSHSCSQQQQESQSTEHHYVPKEAARQFTRTTTVEQMRSKDFIHQLSKRAHKYHQDGVREGDPASTSPADLARQLRHSQAERDRALERERQERQQQQPGPSTSSPPQQQNHTFKAELARLNTNHNRVSLTGHYGSYQPRRNSTGTADPLANPTPSHHLATTRRSMLVLNPTLPNHPETSDSTTTPTSEEPTPIQRFPAHAPEHRVDWTQSDERSKPAPSQPTQQQPQQQQHHSSSRPKLLLSPLLKRADSIFALRSKSKEKEDKGGDRGKSSPLAGGSGPGSAVTSPLATHLVNNGGMLSASTGPGTMLPSPTRLNVRGELPLLSVVASPPLAGGGGAVKDSSKSPTSATKSPSSGGKGFFGRFKR